MSLYDDLDTRQRADKVAGWSSGIKLLQSQLQLKKATTTQPKRESMRKASKVLAPVIDLKSRRDDEDIYPRLAEPAHPKVPLQRSPPHMVPHIPTLITQQNPQISQLAIEYDLIIEDEYNPLFPNEYEKVVKELRDIRDRESDYRHEERDRGDRGDSRNDRGDRNDRDRGERENRDNNRDRKKDRKSRKSRFEENVEPSTPRTGFSGGAEEQSPPRRERDMSNRSAGAAIAPPPSLVETQSSQRPTSPSNGPSQGNSERSYNMPYGASSVAAKIMAKYGFKEGQGLGKSQQGMSMALQVEKTSKRGGRIIHEKEIPIPQPLVPLVASYDMGDMDNSPPQDEDVSSDPMGMMGPPPLPKSAPEPTITEIMKSPSKVVLLRNMVGPGDVDQDLEPEVKDECNTKYGDVTRVLIHELPGAVPEEAVRIFVEFKRIESAIKAVVDLNGRFFGGRQVRAGFYNVESFANLKLLE